jgi:hypothetical protein
MTPLATPADLAARMSGTFDATAVDAALTDASATVRAHAGQVFTRVTTTDLFKVRCDGIIRLPQRPVNDVIEVTAEAQPIEFTWYGDDRLGVAPAFLYVSVESDHGYDQIPDDVVAVTCNVAARALASPPEDAGLVSRSITNYSESFGAVGAAGPAGLFNDERAILARYRRPGSSARLARP